MRQAPRGGRALLPLFPLRAEALQTPLAWLPQPPTPPFACLLRGGAGTPLEPAFPGLCLCGFGGRPHGVPGAGDAAPGWGPCRGNGKACPFFPVPAILRLRFSGGARVASGAALAAGRSGGGERRWAPRAPCASSPECSGSARIDPQVSRAWTQSPGAQEI